MGNSQNTAITLARPAAYSQSSILNYFGLTPDETKRVAAFFSEQTNNSKRMGFKEFSNAFRVLNKNAPTTDISKYKRRAFLAADSNEDGKATEMNFLIHT